MSDAFDSAMARVEGQLLTTGVASIRVKDGQMFFFSAEKLAEMLAIARANEAGRLTVFVKHGPDASEIVLQ